MPPGHEHHGARGAEEKVFRDVLRRYTDSDAIDQSDLRHFLEAVGFKPRSKAERELLSLDYKGPRPRVHVRNHTLRNLDTLDVKFDTLFQAAGRL